MLFVKEILAGRHAPQCQFACSISLVTHAILGLRYFHVAQSGILSVRQSLLISLGWQSQDYRIPISISMPLSGTSQGNHRKCAKWKKIFARYCQAAFLISYPNVSMPLRRSFTGSLEANSRYWYLQVQVLPHELISYVKFLMSPIPSKLFKIISKL